MNKIKNKFKVVNISEKNSSCSNCGINILDMHNFTYKSVYDNKPRYKEELCECSVCKKQFILRYDLFDLDGHIKAEIFSGDINNPKYNWVDNLTAEQKEEIAVHINNCGLCKDKLSEEILLDAWFADTINQLRGKND